MACSKIEMETNELQQQIQDHFEDPYHRGRCDYPTHAAEAEAPCLASTDVASSTDKHAGNDLIAVELRIVGDQLSELWFDGRGCTCSLGIASMLAEKLEGQRTSDVLGLSWETAIRELKITMQPGQDVCGRAGLDAIKVAIKSPLDDSDDGPIFAGPNLGDEC